MEEMRKSSIKIASIVRWSILFVVLVIILWVFFTHFFQDTSKSGTTLYTCPMHPTYTSTQMGECPICGMSLVPVTQTQKDISENPNNKPINSNTNKELDSNSSPVYTCPMHPDVISDKEGRCPICNMKLVKKEDSSMSHPTGHTAKEEGINIHIADNRLNLIGITYTEVKRKEIEDYINVFGSIVYDDAKKTRLHIRTSGFIEKIYKREGDFVNIGERLFSIYSPEIFQTEEEYVNLINRQDIASQYELIRSIEEKFKLLNVPAEEVSRLRREKKAVEYIDMLSPVKGYITKKLVLEKEFITHSTPLFEIIDTSTVFLVLSVFEENLLSIKPNADIVFVPESIPDLEFRGKIGIIYPSFKEGLRVGIVRVILKNPNNLLKAGMFGMTKIILGKRNTLLLNRDAIVFGGENYYVFKVVEQNMFEKRVIKIGKRYNDEYEILNGLSEGDKVVLNGNFLLDSESSIQSAYNKTSTETHKH